MTLSPSFDPPIDEATCAIYEAVAAGLNAAGAARGLPAMRWTPHHDWAPASRRSRVYGRPEVADGDRAGVVAAQEWARILDLAELDRDQTWKTLQETYAEDVRLWHGVVSGIRVILLVGTIAPDERQAVAPDPADVEDLRATMRAGRFHPDRSTQPLRLDSV